MNRTDRLYALVEELRARAPRTMSARELAERFEVSVRTIERDILALMSSGVPIWSETGRRGGYGLDPRRTLPPLNLTPEEATVLAIALAAAREGPFGEAARTAGQKLAAVLSAEGAQGAESLAARVRVTSERQGRIPRALLRTIEQGVVDRAVLTLDYTDRHGDRTTRQVEAHGLLGGDHGWYLIGWCRMRTDGRVFRLDRIRSATPTGERAPERDVDEVLGYVPGHVARPDLVE